MHPMLNTAVKAARRAAAIIMRATNNLDALTVRHKSPNDLVSEVDRAAEAAIIDVLKSAYPDHAFLGEESGQHGESDHVWIIDPLDGTTNFLHGFPVFCVSIGMTFKGVLTHGLVYDPVHNDLFTASRGAGAFLNDRRIRVSRRDKLIDGLIGTGFPFRMKDWTDAYVAMMKEFMHKTAGIRRPGAAALDLANVAAGRLDGFWEIGLHPWDMAAGALLVQEAGGIVTDLGGDGDYLGRGHILAATPKLYPQMLEVIGRHLPVGLRDGVAQRAV
jgi:myo-inositol-1(or 4)-monophosphatase